MDNGQKTRFYSTLDSYVAAYLVLRGHRPNLIDQGQKVVFAFSENDALYNALADYNSGAIVEALKFAFIIKQLKSQIFSRRDKDGFKGQEKQKR
jgi:hypothetical protein